MGFIMKIILGLITFLILSSCGSKSSSTTGNSNGQQGVNNIPPIANCQNLNNCQVQIINHPPVLEFSFKLPNNTTAVYDIKMYRKSDSGEETIGSVYCGNGTCDYTPWHMFTPLVGSGDSGTVSTLKLQYNVGIFNSNFDFFHLNIIKK